MLDAWDDAFEREPSELHQRDLRACLRRHVELLQCVGRGASHARQSRRHVVRLAINVLNPARRQSGQSEPHDAVHFHHRHAQQTCTCSVDIHAHIAAGGAKRILHVPRAWNGGENALEPACKASQRVEIRADEPDRDRRLERRTVFVFTNRDATIGVSVEDRAQRVEHLRRVPRIEHRDPRHHFGKVGPVVLRCHVVVQEGVAMPDVGQHVLNAGAFMERALHVACGAVSLCQRSVIGHGDGDTELRDSGLREERKAQQGNQAE